MKIHALRAQYLSGAITPATAIGEIFDRIRREGESPIWISLADEREAIEPHMK